MSRSAAVLLVLALFAVAVLTACGSDDSGGSSTSDKAAATSTQTAPPAAATSTQPTAPTATGTETTVAAATPKTNEESRAKCHAIFDAFVVKLHKVQDDVDGTPGFKAYHAAVRDLLQRYPTLPIAKVPSPSCSKSVSQPVTGAYVKYYLADQAWTDCRRRDRCATAMADIKKLWAEARTYLKSADEGFSAVTKR